MSTKKAKTASKNNPTGRKSAREYLYQGKKIKPVKIVDEGRSFIGAEYDSNSELVLCESGAPATWRSVAVNPFK